MQLLSYLYRDEFHDAWSRGRVMADAQNFARKLMDTPSNHLTPTMFVSTVSQTLGELDNAQRSRLEIHAR